MATTRRGGCGGCWGVRAAGDSCCSCARTTSSCCCWQPWHHADAVHAVGLTPDTWEGRQSLALTLQGWRFEVASLRRWGEMDLRVSLDANRRLWTKKSFSESLWSCACLVLASGQTASLKYFIGVTDGCPDRNPPFSLESQGWFGLKIYLLDLSFPYWKHSQEAPEAV